MSLVATPFMTVATAPSLSLKTSEAPVKDQKVNRVVTYESVVSPETLRQAIPLRPESERVIENARKACADVISGKDDRLIVVVGPCSIHDPTQAIHYGQMLGSVFHWFPDLVIIMRAYFEKPRTTVGWKGLINDPKLDGSCHIDEGIKLARSLLSELTFMGIPVGTEVLDTISPQYLSEMISWGSIGARTSQSQPHREITSGIPHPMGFKNGTDGSMAVAIDAMKSASSPHSFLGINETGVASVIKTTGNDDVHVILRGGNARPNYSEKDVKEARDALLRHAPNHSPSIMIDCSHGNSQKNHRNQSKVVEDVCAQIRSGNKNVTGVMIESNIKEGRQDIPPQGPAKLAYGVSITDACVDFEETVEMLKQLQASVIERRKVTKFE